MTVYNIGKSGFNPPRKVRNSAYFEQFKVKKGIVASAKLGYS